MKAIIAAIALGAVLTACGSGDAADSRPETTSGADTSSGAASSATGGSATAGSSASAGSSTRASTSSASAAKTLGNRKGELVNPDNEAMVYLYYDLSGVAPPIDEWVEKDFRMHMARPPEKQATRETVRAEYQAAAAAVRGVGLLRLSLQAKLSDYDPTYSEFTVGAFAPSSVVDYYAFGRKVSLRFGNGRDAQLWRVDASEAQAIRDRIGRHNAFVDALVAITGVQPAAEGGSVIVDVIEYELRSNEVTKHLIGRVRVAR